jgi:2-polyprenyl-3-methyl-5-hydroxy-6-metoxy-1,4-benzoquinol methylase
MTSASAAPRARADWPTLLNAASAPYRGAGQFAWRFARGKLGLDPVFRHLLREGLIKPSARVLDIGCGQGLLASLLRSCSAIEHEGRWPNGWAAA